MKNIEIVSKVVSREGEAKHSPSKDISSANISDYLLKSIWDKVWEIRTDSQGTEYIFGKLPVVTQYGITMYSGDGVDVPSLASGLPFDGRTIWYNPDTQQIEVIGGTGGGSGEGVSNFWDLSGIPSWITNSKPKYTYSEIEGTPDLTKYALDSQIPSLSGYATESWVLQKNYATKATTLSGYGITDAYTKTNVDDLLKSYVTLGGTQTITGEKNFTGGLKVNGSHIYYDTEKKYWKLEGDLLVTGGVTMYGSDSSFTPSTIMDALLYDDTTLGINSNGQLYVKGGAGGGINTTYLQNYLTSNSYLNVTSGDNRYLKLSGGSMNGVITMKINNQIQWGSSSMMIYGEDVNAIKIVAPLGLYVNSKEVWHKGNFTPSNYLPLSGGTLSGNLTIQNTSVDIITLHRASNSGSPSIKFTNKSDGTLGYMGVSDSSRGLQPFFMDTGSSVFKIWHSGNDGSGSGLDADTLDGLHNGELKSSTLHSGGGFAVDANTLHFSDYSLRFYSGIPNTSTNFPTSSGYQNGLLALPLHSNGSTAQIYLSVGKNPYFRSHHTYEWNELAYKNDNVASATKLQTARTIWGQYFDGTGNVDGALTINKATTSSGDHGACVLINGNYAETGFHRALSYENQKMVVGSTAAMYVGAKNTQYNGGFLGFKYVSANSSSNYMSIGLYAANDLLCVLGNGNVGIGTPNPSAKFQVNGNAAIYSSSAGVISLYRTVSDGGSYVDYYPLNQTSQKWRVGAGSVDEFFYEAADGSNLARICHHATKGTRLEVGKRFLSVQPSGSDADRSVITLISNGDSPTDFIMGSGNYAWSITSRNSAEGHLLGFYSALSGQYAMRVYKEGNVLVTGGLTMYSDQRKKTILNHVELSLKQIANAPLIEHYYNGDDKRTTHVGSIAQYWASMNDWFCKLDSEGYYTMEIQNAALASAISIARELDRYETKTDKAIKKLKKRICELEEEVERLKAS